MIKAPKFSSVFITKAIHMRLVTVLGCISQVKHKSKNKHVSTFRQRILLFKQSYIFTVCKYVIVIRDLYVA